MAGMVTWSLLRELAGFRAEKGCAISLCLNLDPSEVPTAGDAQTRMNSMLNAADKTDRTDLTHEQLFLLISGRLAYIADHYDEQPVQHDQGGWSQSRYQRHIEKLVQEHLKGLAQELDRSKRQLQSPKVVLVCSEEMRSEFTDALS